ncbi:fatty acid--CoA ligase family protein [Salirhabdus salicampi]|uniref:fatty acid--CoA ligase family protein n=1 Tax=Salirhabdus salicampi TaxID=476102 RepID=UPI0020C49E39|nr:fatty acid--CoA ligase family protein [Salirhabdus salicampi]MCP8615528.1 fatty acid--CoA ligase family protein [Salirhabdus salicampi]
MNISDQLTVTTEKQADKTAYIFLGKETSYRDLDDSVTKFASSLNEMGYGKGDHLAIVLGNSPQFVISLYASLRIGATVIPINPLYTADELTYIINNGDVKGIITMDVLAEKFAQFDHELNVNHYILVETNPNVSVEDLSIQPKVYSFSTLLQNGSPQLDRPTLHDNDTAVILYTSGTTGKPKGAMLSHQNIYSNAKDIADYLNMNNQDRIIAALPMFHVFCLTVALNAPLMNGGSIFIMPKFSPNEVFDAARDYKVTIFAGVPTMYNYLLQYPEGKADDFSNMRLCISGGAPMPVALLNNFETKFQVIISEGYGLSEASPATCFNPLDRPRKAGSIGQSITNVENKVVDAEGNEVPIGEIGELIVKGPNVMKGYYKMPEETKATIKDGWLYTGDMAKKDEEGYFYIVDRKKDLIIVGGYNVYPREVEEVLYDHPSIAEVAVIGKPDPNLGEVVNAYVVTKEGETVTYDQLRVHCYNFLAEYKVPSSFTFMDELPKNTTGKILRRALKEQFNRS